MRILGGRTNFYGQPWFNFLIIGIFLLALAAIAAGF